MYPTWIKSLYVWGPVQVVQQAWVPLEYRVAVFNLVSYFWDTYLAIKMAPEPRGADLEQLQVAGSRSTADEPFTSPAANVGSGAMAGTAMSTVTASPPNGTEEASYSWGGVGGCEPQRPDLEPPVSGVMSTTKVVPLMVQPLKTLLVDSDTAAMAAVPTATASPDDTGGSGSC